MGLGILRRIGKMAGIGLLAGAQLPAGAMPAGNIGEELYLVEDTARAEQYPIEDAAREEQYPIEDAAGAEQYPVEDAAGEKLYLVADTAGAETYPLVYGAWTIDDEDVIELWEDGAEYEVLPGDCLWEICERLWGDGRLYGELAAANEDEIRNPDLILPGMRLYTGRRGYIVRKEAKYGGMRTGEYSMDVPGSWTVGTISSGGASANLVLSGDGLETIACLVQDRREETALTVRDWEACAEGIRKYVDEHYGERVSDLSLEHYLTGQGEEVCLYSFLWEINLPESGGSMPLCVCMGMKLTEHMQAEFLGFAGSWDIRGGVRYVAASFQEQEGYDPEVSSVNASNMAILPQTPWEMEGLLDPFPWVEEFFDALVGEAEGRDPEPESPREELIRQIARPAGRQ